MLLQRWQQMLYHNVVATLPQRWYNIVRMLENNIILHCCHNVATMLKTTLDHNVGTTFRQHCVNVLWKLAPNIEFWPNDNVQATLWECWCPTLSDQTTTFRHCCHNVVATLKNNIKFQCCHNIVLTLRINVIFNVATTFLQHCRNTPRIRNLISDFGIKF